MPSYRDLIDDTPETPPADLAEPTLTVLPVTDPATAVVLVLHGGREHSTEPTATCQLAYRRMVPFARAVHRLPRGRQLAVALLRNRLRGWNEPATDPVADATWALSELTRRHPGVPVVLVGHSMGARAAVRVAGFPSVTAVCALAPWLPPDEPVDQLAGRTLLIAHGDRDRWTDPAASLAYATRARERAEAVCRFVLAGSGHPMLRRARDWTVLTTGFVAGVLALREQLSVVTEAMRAPAPSGLTYPLPRGLAHRH